MRVRGSCGRPATRRRRFAAAAVTALTGALTVLIASTPAGAGFAWRRLASGPGGPTPRRGVAGLLDASRRRLVFQGGETPSSRFLGDVWFFSLQQQRWKSGGTPAPPRCHHTFVAARDGDRLRGLLFGGFPRTDALFAWYASGDAWEDITPGGTGPSPRCLHQAVLCPERRRMVVYGGLVGAFQPDLDDMWAYDLDTAMWAPIGDRQAPGRRYGHLMVLDGRRDRLVLFGGFARGAGESRASDAGDLWTFDLGTERWTRVRAAGAVPPPRQFPAGAVTSDGESMLLFGGRSGGAFLDDLWLLDLATLAWSEIDVPGDRPAPRFRHTGIIDPAANRFWIAFGEGKGRTHFDDVWVLEWDDSPPDVNADGAPFVRGDCNGDGSVDAISDAVFLLLFTFAGGAAPSCAAACDVDGDGEISGVTDAVALLTYQFLGGPAPGAPFPACGPAASPGDRALGCRSAPPCP